MTWAQSIGDIFAALAVIGIGYQLVSVVAFWRFFRRTGSPFASAEAVTILKPLFGDEPKLTENLTTFLVQDHTGPLQMLCGVGDAGDAAVPQVEILIRSSRAKSRDWPSEAEAFSAAGIRLRLNQSFDFARDERMLVELAVGPFPACANAKIGNLCNMMRAAKHDILILSDSDMVVGPNYLSHLLSTLNQPNVGAVTCLYAGRADAGIWSQLNAAIISYSGAPKVTMSLFTGAAVPCMGSTIALRRQTLEQIGGFERFADVLADDYAMGEAIRATGKSIAMPPMLLTHACPDASFSEMWRQHRRWAITIRGVQPFLHVASGVVYAVPFSLLALLFLPLLGLALLACALTVRFAAKHSVDSIARRKTAPFWLVPVADCIEFAVWSTSLTARTIHWRGSRLTVKPDGRI